MRRVPRASELAVYSEPRSSQLHGSEPRGYKSRRAALLDDPDQIGAIGEVAVMESEPSVTFMRILVEVIDAAGVERRCTPLDPMHLVALFEQQLRQVAAVLPRDACDHRGFWRGGGH